MTTHEMTVKNAGRIARFSEKKGINAACREFGISNWSVYVARQLQGEYVPPATRTLIKERNTSMRTKKSRSR